jgi:serine/threonine protein kinase
VSGPKPVPTLRAQVKVGVHILTGERVAVKVLEKDRIVDKGDVKRVSREIQILKHIQHPNLIHLLEVRPLCSSKYTPPPVWSKWMWMCLRFRSSSASSTQT